MAMRPYISAPLTTMRDARHVHDSRCVVDLVHNALVANANTPFLVAAPKFLATVRAGHGTQSFDAWHNPGHYICG
jgi:hypothetical protein